MRSFFLGSTLSCVSGFSVAGFCVAGFFVAGFCVAGLSVTGCAGSTSSNMPAKSEEPQSSTVPTPADDAGSSAKPAPTREQKLIARMLRRVARARGIESDHPILGAVLSRAELIARVKAHVTKEIPPQAIRNEGLVLQLLGAVPSAFDYETAAYSLLEAQLAGYYEPEDKTMYLANDLSDEDADATLAHELVHALQDLRWDLKSRAKYRPGEGDKSSSISALAEGDATSAMFDVLIDAARSGSSALDIPESFFVEQIRQSINHGPGATAPRIMRTSLAAPYIFGTLFINDLRRHGGWDEVNHAWDTPPSTTEQILHPEKWRTHEAGLAVDPATVRSLAAYVHPTKPGEAWTLSDSDTFGELGARILFEEWMDIDKAAEIATDWGGDRGALFAQGDRSAFAWRLRYDGGNKAEPRAKKAFAAIADGLTKNVGKPALRDGNFVCVERLGRGPIAVYRKQGDILFVAGPATVTKDKWESGGTCGESRKWLDAIVSEKAK